jgi:proteasome lid subunit RPN8/RPN11
MSRVPKNSGSRPEALAPGRPVLAITEAVIRASEHYLRAELWQPTEKVVYWAGIKRPDVCTATTVIRPAARLTRGSFRTTPEANAEVIAFLSDRGLALVGQVHTHPGPWVDHSGGDDEDAFMPRENYISIVVPSYCRAGMLPIEHCGVHRYEARTFRRITGDELHASVCVLGLKQDFAA